MEDWSVEILLETSAIGNLTQVCKVCKVSKLFLVNVNDAPTPENPPTNCALLEDIIVRRAGMASRTVEE